MQPSEGLKRSQSDTNEVTERSIQSLLDEADEQRRADPHTQLSGAEQFLVMQAAKNGLDVNTGEQLQPGQTPPPLEGSSAATHQDQQEIARPYQTERIEQAQDVDDNLTHATNFIERSVQNQLNIGSMIGDGMQKIAKLADAETKRSALDRADPDVKTGNRAGPKQKISNKEAQKVWSKVDKLVKSNSSNIVQMSTDEFEAVLDGEYEQVRNYNADQLATDGYYWMQLGGKGDSKFFDYKDEQTPFVIDGQDDNGGLGYQANDINYIKVGMNAAAAGRTFSELRAMIIAHNGKNIIDHVGRSIGDLQFGELVDAEPYRHNIRQIETGARWAKVGYDAFLKRDRVSKK